MLLAATPSAELSIAIPYAIGFAKMSWPLAMTLAIIGNMLPMLVIIWYMHIIAGFFADRIPVLKRFLHWWFARTHGNAAEKVRKYGVWALIPFTAIPMPLPFMGAYTASVATYLFDLPRGKATLAIFIGVCISATIMTLVTLGFIQGLDWILEH